MTNSNLQSIAQNDNLEALKGIDTESINDLLEIILAMDANKLPIKVITALCMYHSEIKDTTDSVDHKTILSDAADEANNVLNRNELNLIQSTLEETMGKEWADAAVAVLGGADANNAVAVEA